MHRASSGPPKKTRDDAIREFSSDGARIVGVVGLHQNTGIAIDDWNNQGYPDIFVTHWIYEQNALFDNLTLVAILL